MIEVLDGIKETVNYPEGFKIRIYKNKEYEDYPQHWHTAFEIIMPVENTYKAIIDEKTYNLDMKDIIVISPGTLHQLFAPPGGYRIILQVDYSVFSDIKELKSIFHMFHPCVLITASSMVHIHEELSSLISDITAEYFSTLRFREASIYSMILRFFVILGRNCTDRKNKLSNIKNKKWPEYIEIFIDVCNYINDHCTENIKLDNISKVAGFSKSHFSRLFKQVMNISWYNYLINCRIMQAEKLLIEPSLSIMQVAMKSGFGSLATFNRLFRTKRGCTPTEYKSLYTKIL